VLLVHGVAAHLGWWDAMLETVGDAWNVAGLETSGHGRSEHRADGYSPSEHWIPETVAVLDAAFGGEPATIVGHSMGGLVSLGAAAAVPDRVERVITIDTNIRVPEPATFDLARGVPGKPPRVYPDLDEAVARFKVRPGDTVAVPEVLEPVARSSFERVEGGWRLAADYRVLGRFTDRMVDALLRRQHGSVVVFGGELSPNVTERAVRYIASAVGRPVPWGMIPGAYHHVMLDAPAALGERLLEVVGDPHPERLPWMSLAQPADPPGSAIGAETEVA